VIPDSISEDDDFAAINFKTLYQLQATDTNDRPEFLLLGIKTTSLN
jgi:hypothetical protein